MVKAFSLHSVGVLSALALALVSPGLRAQEEEKVLNIYNWSDYIGEEVIALTFGLSYLFDLNTTMKFEYRLDRANQPMFLNVKDGTYRVSNGLFGASVLVSF